MAKWNMSKVLLITKRIMESPIGGRELLCKLNHDMLKEIHRENYRVLELEKATQIKPNKYIGLFRGYIDGVSPDSICQAISLIHSEDIKIVFIDGSNLGSIAAAIKGKFKHIQIITFFHNVQSNIS